MGGAIAAAGWLVVTVVSAMIVVKGNWFSFKERALFTVGLLAGGLVLVGAGAVLGAMGMVGEQGRWVVVQALRLVLGVGAMNALVALGVGEIELFTLEKYG